MAKDINDFRQYIQEFKSLTKFDSFVIGHILYKLYIQELAFEEIATFIISNDKIYHLTENSRSSVIEEIRKVYEKAEFLKKSIDFYWQKIKIFAETELFSFDFDMGVPKPRKANKRKVEDLSISSASARILDAPTPVVTAYRGTKAHRLKCLQIEKAAIQKQIKRAKNKITMLEFEMKLSEAEKSAAVREAASPSCIEEFVGGSGQ